MEERMKYCIADWHYPHRTFLENIDFFVEHGYDAVSVLGSQFIEAIRDAEVRQGLAERLSRYRIPFTVHHRLPADHAEETLEVFAEEMRDTAAFQEETGAITILSFDVPDVIRGHIAEDVKMVLGTVPGCRVAVEDYGLTEEEVRDAEQLRDEPRFGYLIDIGHMNIRLNGKNDEPWQLFHNSPVEDAKGNDTAGFVKALRSKPFDIVEIHFHNNDNISDLHMFLEDGALDMEVPLRAIKEIGFTGILTIESAPGFKFPCYGEEADRRILATTEYFHKLVDKVYGC